MPSTSQPKHQRRIRTDEMMEERDRAKEKVVVFW